MIEWKPVELSDKEWIQPLLNNHKNNSCIYCFGNIFSYGKQLKALCAKICDCFVMRINHAESVSYCYPIGERVFDALKEIFAEISMLDTDAVIYGLSEDEASEFNAQYDGNYIALPDRDSFDYIYNSFDLIHLVGKKYQPKRNHISFFERNNNWTYESLTKDNFAECIEMNKKWIEEKQENRLDLLKELEIIKIVFENFDELNYIGGVLRVDGKIIAYTMGEALDSETFCVHFEKAYSDIRGAYPMINKQFVLNELSAYRFVNREEDLGIDGLRKAKLSYHPCKFEEKFEVKILRDAD